MTWTNNNFLSSSSHQVENVFANSGFFTHPSVTVLNPKKRHWLKKKNDLADLTKCVSLSFKTFHKKQDIQDEYVFSYLCPSLTHWGVNTKAIAGIGGRGANISNKLYEIQEIVKQERKKRRKWKRVVSLETRKVSRCHHLFGGKFEFSLPFSSIFGPYQLLCVSGCAVVKYPMMIFSDISRPLLSSCPLIRCFF